MAAEHWFRWHHGTITDPKWRVIAKRAGHALSRIVTVANVTSVWAAMLECASQASPRGELVSWDDEDIGVALDVPTEEVTAIREAMQGKTLDGNKLTAWNERQIKREDNTATQRKRAQRQREKETLTQCDESESHAMSRTVTTETETETETDKREKKRASQGSRLPADWQPSETEIRWAVDARPDLETKTEVEKFRDYWHAKTGQGATKRDWAATWRNWIRNANGPPRGRAAPSAAPSPAASRPL